MNVTHPSNEQWLRFLVGLGLDPKRVLKGTSLSLTDEDIATVTLRIVVEPDDIKRLIEDDE